VHGAAAWDRLSAAVGGPVLNMGFGWDRTQNVLWRLRQGEFTGLTPQWVVLMIGTNNLTGTANARASTPEEIVEAIAEICREVHERSAQSRIVVMGILPRGFAPGTRLRASILKTNRLLAEHFKNDSVVVYADIGAKFLLPGGTQPKALMPDGTHPSEAGYQLWEESLEGLFAGLQPMP